MAALFRGNYHYYVIIKINGLMADMGMPLTRAREMTKLGHVFQFTAGHTCMNN